MKVPLQESSTASPLREPAVSGLELWAGLQLHVSATARPAPTLGRNNPPDERSTRPNPAAEAAPKAADTNGPS